MEKNNQKINSLVKRKTLNKILKKAGIKRASKKAIILLEKNILEEIQRLAKELKQEMIINGRETLKEKDVINSINKIKPKKEYINWED